MPLPDPPPAAVPEESPCESCKTEARALLRDERWRFKDVRGLNNVILDARLSEHAMAEKVATLLHRFHVRIEQAHAGLVEMQKHRDTWRGYAYGRRSKPTDFLDGNMVEEDRGPTAIEKAEADVARLLSALQQIMRREGAFSRDPLEHARNTIDNMAEIASSAFHHSEPRR